MLGDPIGYGYQPLFEWTQAGGTGKNTLGNGFANIVLSPPFSTVDVEQLGIAFITLNGASASLSTAAVARLLFSCDGGSVFSYDTVTAASAPSSSVIQKTMYFAEWGPFTTSFLLPRPVCATHCAIGIYSNGAPSAGDTIRVTIALQRGAQAMIQRQ